MFGSLIRALVVVVVLVGGAAFLLGWWGHDRVRISDGPRDVVGTSGVDTTKARQVGAEVGEKTAVAAAEAKRALLEGRITAKIKAKMALDDSVKALNVDVDTNGSSVTVSGIVDSGAQRERVLRLARETDGVTNVVDRLHVRR